MKKGKPMTCRWCGKGIRRLPDKTHTHRVRLSVRTSEAIDLGLVTLPAKTTAEYLPEQAECYTRKHGMRTAEPMPGRVTLP